MSENTGVNAGTQLDKTSPEPTGPVAAEPVGLKPPSRASEIFGRPRIYLPLVLVVLVCLIAVFPGMFAGWFGHGDPRVCNLMDSGGGPESGHPFGFDIQGCDLYANVVYGTRSSVLIAVMVTAGAMAIAIVLGGLAGYFRGWVDTLISRIMDIFFGFPVLVGQIILLNTFISRNVWTVSFVLAFFLWPAFTRVFRSSVLATSNLDYIVAAKELGAGHLRILTRHVLPNAISPLVAILSLSVGGVITAEAGLTFLGVGLKSPSISWGVQLNVAQRYFTTDLHLLIFPSAFLTVTVLAFVLLGDGLRDALDPKGR